MKKKLNLLMSFNILMLIILLLPASSFGASFDIYFAKLMHFEGDGFGIHKPLWGNRNFSKDEAYRIHRHFYWNRYYGDLFKSQEVAEVFIDQLINAGDGKNRVNIKAFEAVIGVEQDGILSKKDVESANNFMFTEQIVNPYVNYRLHFYRTRKNASHYPGWAVRAKTFYMFKDDGTITSDMLILPKMLEKDLEDGEDPIATPDLDNPIEKKDE
jgi:hypothetical protein